MANGKTSGKELLPTESKYAAEELEALAGK